MLPRSASSSRDRVGTVTRKAYHPLAVHDELLTPQAVQFKDIQLGEYFVCVYGSEKNSECSRHTLYQKIMEDHYVMDGKDEGKLTALNVQQGTTMFMHDTDSVIPVEVIMHLHLACFCSHTGPTGETD